MDLCRSCPEILPLAATAQRPHQLLSELFIIVLPQNLLND
jgi:hypothetical protein